MPTSPSSPQPTRRSVLKGAALGTALAVAPVRLFDAAAAEGPARRGVFGYGVASGDPLATAVVLWTRATPPTPDGAPVATPGSGRGAPLTVRWELAADEEFAHVVKTGTVRTSPRSDHTVKGDVRGLAPYTRYWYRFRAAGETSPVGRTQTAPDVADDVHALRLALVSCSNYTGGFFTAYRAIGRRDDLDFVLHLGDYIYEYPNSGEGADGRYGPDALIGVRDARPAGETVDLAGYRLRHALHKADPDAQLAHRQHPWITIFDDHEIANNTWDTNAQNHTGDEGSFAERRRQAFQAYLEWMPLRLPEQDVPHRGTRFFRQFTFGRLADLSVLDTRQNRSRQVEHPDTVGEAVRGGGFIPALPELEPALQDPDRHLPEPEQLAWLRDNLAQRRAWHLVGNQTIFAPIRFPGLLFGGDRNFVNSDQWDGYQSDQGRLVRYLARQEPSSGDAVFLTGDIHSSWAVEVPRRRVSYAEDGKTVAVEFVCPSVTSDGFYESATGGNPAPDNADNGVFLANAAASLVKFENPWVKYLDGIGHGYALIDVTPARVQADFYLTPLPTPDRPDPRTQRSALPVHAASYLTAAGTNRVAAAPGPVGARSDSPRTAS